MNIEYALCIESSHAQKFNYSVILNKCPHDINESLFSNYAFDSSWMLICIIKLKPTKNITFQTNFKPNFKNRMIATGKID